MIININSLPIYENQSYFLWSNSIDEATRFEVCLITNEFSIFPKNRYYWKRMYSLKTLLGLTLLLIFKNFRKWLSLDWYRRHHTMNYVLSKLAWVYRVPWCHKPIQASSIALYRLDVITAITKTRPVVNWDDLENTRISKKEMKGRRCLCIGSIWQTWTQEWTFIHSNEGAS